MRVRERPCDGNCFRWRAHDHLGPCLRSGARNGPTLTARAVPIAVANAIADIALDRFGKLQAAISTHARGGTLLRAGNEVVCSATGLGELRVVIG